MAQLNVQNLTDEKYFTNIRNNVQRRRAIGRPAAGPCPARAGRRR